MNKKLIAVLATAFAAVLALGLVGCGGGNSGGNGGGDASGETAKLRFVTGGESGTYYAYGSVLAQYATNGDYGVAVTALSGNGSQANVQALEDGDADLAFCQSDVLAYAYDGTNLFHLQPQPQDGCRPEGQDRVGGCCRFGRVLQRH